MDWEGNIVWKDGPNYNESKETKELGWIIGPYHLYMIPKGLPGEGDMLIFDNGGSRGGMALLTQRHRKA